MQWKNILKFNFYFFVTMLFFNYFVIKIVMNIEIVHIIYIFAFPFISNLLLTIRFVLYALDNLRNKPQEISNNTDDIKEITYVSEYIFEIFFQVLYHNPIYFVI